MNNKRKWTLAGVLLPAVLFIGVIIAFFYRSNNKDEDDVVIKDNVRVITQETKDELQPYVVSDDALFFKKDPEYKAGDVIVSGITDVAPAGYIKSVISIEEKDGEYICYTKQATLLDVFEEAHIRKTIVLTDGEGSIDLREADENLLAFNGDSLGMLASAFVVGDRDNENIDDLISVEFEGDVSDYVHVEGEVAAKIWLDMELDIKDGEIIWGLVANDRIHGDILFGYSASAEDDFAKEFFRKKLPNIQFMIGPVPVVITNEVKAQLEGEAEIEGEIGTSLSINVTNTTGFRYSSGQNEVLEINKQDFVTGGLEWDTGLGLEGSANAGVFVYLTSLLYDCSGADIAIGVEGEVDGEVEIGVNKLMQENTPYGKLKLSIYPQVKGGVVVEVPIIDKELAEITLFEKNLTSFWEKEWSLAKTKEDSIEIEEANDTAWIKLFSEVIADTASQIDAGMLFFQERYFIKRPEEEVYGGVSAGYSGDISELMYYLWYRQGEEIPELCIGAKVDGEMTMLAIYAYGRDGNSVSSVATVDNEYCPFIGMCSNEAILSAYSWGDSYRNVDKEDVEGSRDLLIDPNLLSWKGIED